MSAGEQSPYYRLQRRQLPEDAVDLGATTTQLFEQLKHTLHEAVGETLKSSPTDVYKALKLTNDRLVITCGPPPSLPVNFNRVQAPGNHLERDDGAWFDFHLTFSSAKPARLLAYGAELRAPPEAPGPTWLRYDLNPPGHTNDTRDLRSHLHPGRDDVQLPAPVLHPDELVHFCLTALRSDPDRKRRS